MARRWIHKRKLTLHRNFSEYWVCATCGKPRRDKTPLDQPCRRCRASLPPRIRIAHRRGVGDEAHTDSRISKELFRAAGIIRTGFRLGKGTFPPGNPTREILDSITENLPNPKSKLWLCQAFLGGERYFGKLEREICFFGIVEEVAEAMLSEKKMMQIRISGDLHKWLKLYAARNDTTMTEIIIQYLEFLRRKAEKSVQVEQI